VATHALSDSQPNYQSIQTHGPFKPGREQGAADVAVILLAGGKVIRGYDKPMNVNPRILLLKDGVVIERDSYVHDPHGYHVQVYADVLDSYGGFLPASGPVESYRSTPRSPRDPADAAAQQPGRGGGRSRQRGGGRQVPRGPHARERDRRSNERTGLRGD
jgi:hypothetical protein